MAQAVVSIAGRTYRMNCDEGEEAHIDALAQLVDAKITDLRAAFGEIGDQRIVVMAALTVADELFAANKKLEEQGEELAQARDQADLLKMRQQEWAEWMASTLSEAAERIASAARTLNADRG